MSGDAPIPIDPLTGLPMRDGLPALLGGAGRDGRALLLLGVDRFGLLNDTYGPRAADDVLQTIARRLQHAVGAGGTLTRWGSDEFAVLCEGADGAAAGDLAERMLDALRSSFAIDERAVHLDASIGVVLSDRAQDSRDDLIRDAGIALCRAKAEGGGRWRRFDPAMRTELLQRSALEHDLRLGIERGELVLFFQPVVSLDTRRIVALETLVRWRHPDRGLLQPAAFLPVAEQSGLIVPLGRWVLTEACRALARWSADARLADVTLSVNIAGRQLADPRLPDELAAVLQRTGIAPDRLMLELSETLLIGQSATSSDALERLLGLGLRLALDDFGAGWTSMTHLRDLPIEALKVDRSFVARITDSERDRHVFRTIVALGRGLGVEVIAAGVETSEQAACVADLGCRAAQGYWFAPPVPAEGAEALLRDGLPSTSQTASAPASPASPASPAPPAPPAAAVPAVSAPATSTCPEPGITLSEAADALGVSTSTLRRWADAGRIASERTPGGHRRFALSALRAFQADTAAGAVRPVVRGVDLPSTPLASLARLLQADGARLGEAAVRLAYEPPRLGWFASDEGQEALNTWAGAVAVAVGAGDHASAIPATTRLLRAAELHGTSLLERHAFLESYGDLAVRALQQRGAAHAEIVGAGRVLRRLRSVVLEDAD